MKYKKGFKKIKTKKYNVSIVFNATRCDLEISKEKIKRLKEIQKEIQKLVKEQDKLFKEMKNDTIRTL